MAEAGTVPTPQEVADRLAISEILSLHCRGVDRADLSALQACYWPEAKTYYGTDALGAHEFAEGLVEAIQGFAQTQHMVTNTLFRFSGEKASVESSVLAFHYLSDAEGADSEMTYIGRYIDEFEKRGSVWKIIERIPVMSWNQNSPASTDSENPALAGLQRSSRKPDDIVYQS